MGSPVSPIVANLYMEMFEQKALSTYSHPPFIWKRYVDDTFVVIHEYEVEGFTHHLNNIDPHIKFTMERDTEGKLPFLDTLVCLQDDGSLKTTDYRKKTHNAQYLQFDSNHHLSHKRSVVRTLMHRAEVAVTDQEDVQKEKKHVREVLSDNGYQKWMYKVPIRKQKICETPQKKRLRQVPIPYMRGLSEKLQGTFDKYNIGVIHKPFNTIRSALVKPKDKTSKLDVCGTVYLITCSTCNQSYVGETTRALKTRLKEHTRTAGPLTAIGELCQTTGHKVSEDT
jgi:hypothetical protein